MEKKYQIIYADPPWQYKVWSKKGNGRSAESHYRTMNIEDIINLKEFINKISDKNCILFWSTFSFLREKQRFFNQNYFVVSTNSSILSAARWIDSLTGSAVRRLYTNVAL